MKENRDFGLIFWLHFMFILAILSSPFWLSWKFIIVGICLYYLQLLLVGDCILTRWQFRSTKREITFYSHVLEKFGLNFNRQKVRFVADFIMPLAILIIAFAWQLFLN